MRIKTVLEVLREIKYIKYVIKRYGNSLERGRYYQYNSFRALSLDDVLVKEKAFGYFNRKVIKNKRMAQVAEILNKFHFFVNRNRHSTEEYDSIYTANNFEKVREVKLFSFKNGKILTVCTNAQELKNQLKQYETFGRKYNMPMVKKNDKYENSFEISMVHLKEFKGDFFALKNIADSTVANNPNVETLKKICVKELLDYSYDDEMNLYLKKLTDKIDPLFENIEIPICVQHGDLSKDNLIYGECDGKTDFWWIDWEHVGERVFFYDYFFYIINSALYGEMGSFGCYIKGETDKMLIEMFDHFGITFNREKRFDYFLIFTIAFLKERVCSKSGLSALKEYYELIEAMELVAKGENN